MPANHIYRRFTKLIDLRCNKHLSVVAGNSNYQGYGIHIKQRIAPCGDRITRDEVVKLTTYKTNQHAYRFQDNLIDADNLISQSLQ